MMTELTGILAAIVGPDHVLNQTRLTMRDPGYCPHSLDAGLLVRPGNAAELSELCRAASQCGISLVPHGGLTGLVEGTASEPGQVIISFERMTSIHRIDPSQGIAIVDAGVTLEALAGEAEKHGLMFGVDIPARGSCTLGGMIATNAGGTRVLQYGMTRPNVLGLEAVLADGRILDLTNTLLKNNTGYDLKQVFIGSEGTLGLVTRAVLKLTPIPKATSCALLACESEAHLPALFETMRKELGARLLSFEAMWPDYYRLTTSQPGFGREPLAPDHGLYAIVEVAGPTDDEARDALLGVLEPVFEAGLVADAVVAQSETERAALWRIREDSDAIEAGHEASLSYDVGLELQDLSAFTDRLFTRFAEVFPGIIPYTFGHVGDGNLHVMFGITAAQLAERKPFDDLLYDTLADFPRSTISAEHGIGLEKRAYLDRSVPREAQELMRQFKTMLDPDNILNPGKIIAPA